MFFSSFRFSSSSFRFSSLSAKQNEDLEAYRLNHQSKRYRE
jgi:hypothetical protein